jgi:hypothetical protein
VKLNILRTSILLGIFVLLAGISACAHEVSHTESDKANWFDSGRTRTETTVTQNADGTINSESSKQVTHYGRRIPGSGLGASLRQLPERPGALFMLDHQWVKRVEENSK